MYADLVLRLFLSIMLARHVRSFSTIAGVQKLALSRYSGCAFRCRHQLRPTHQIMRQLSATATDEKPAVSQVIPAPVLARSPRQKRVPKANVLYEIKHMTYTDIIALFDKIQQGKEEVKFVEIAAILNVCTKAEHVEDALRIADRIKQMQGSLHSPGYLTIIRCYADANQLDAAMEWLKEAVMANVQVRARHFQPIIEALVRDENLPKLIDLLNYMLALSVRIKEDSFAPLLNLLGKPKVRSELQKHIYLREAVHMLFTSVGDDLFGLLARTQRDVVVHNSHIDAKKVVAQGVLVSTLEDIVAPIVDKEMLSLTGSVRAINTSFSSTAMETLNPSAQLPVEEGESLVTLVKEKYLILSELERIKAASDGETAVPQKNFLNVFQQQPFTHNSARIVDISRTTCRCPNCDGLVQSIGLTEEERRAAAEELHKFVQTRCWGKVDPLVEFSKVLREGQYEYIVDAANVGYSRQNFVGGKFSFRQVELVVEMLKKRSSSILVILPHAYTHKEKLHNSIRSARGHGGCEPVTPEDTRILEKLRAENMLYVTPPSADDDWFWMFSTLYEGRQGPVQVITNDFMRDHKVLFADQKAFLRWRSAHIAYFDISQAVVEGKTETGDAPQEGAVEVFLQEPSKFTREMQRSTVGDYWHIPALDRNVWLCLNTAAPPPTPQN